MVGFWSEDGGDLNNTNTMRNATLAALAIAGVAGGGMAMKYYAPKATQEPKASESVPLKADTAFQASMIDIEGVRLDENSRDVKKFLEISIPCRTWIDGEAPFYVTMLDLLKMRVRGDGGFPISYEVTEVIDDGEKYVRVRERARMKDGSGLKGAPGFVNRFYAIDHTQARLIGYNSEDPKYPLSLLSGPESDPLSFFERHWDAVCNNLPAKDRRARWTGPMQTD